MASFHSGRDPCDIGLCASRVLEQPCSFWRPFWLGSKPVLDTTTLRFNRTVGGTSTTGPARNPGLSNRERPER